MGHERQVKIRRDPNSRQEQLAKSVRPQNVLREVGKTQGSAQQLGTAEVLGKAGRFAE